MGGIESIILAAGEGTRMKSNLCKVVHKICGKEMAAWVLDAAKSAGSKKATLVVGHKQEQVRDAIGEKADYVVQNKQLGTGHAVIQAIPNIDKNTDNVLILCGDTPLINSETLKQALNYHIKNNYSATVITTFVDNPKGYGRIVRKDDNSIDKIVEQKDASQDELLINEINSGMYCFKIDALKDAVLSLDDNNSQKEYYLTDTIEILNKKGQKVGGYVCEQPVEIMGVNNRVQLSRAESEMKKTINEKHMLGGVTIIDPNNTYIGSDVVIGIDTVVCPGAVLEGNTEIGSNCSIGPYSRIVDSIICDGASINNSVIFNSSIGENTKVGPFAYVRPQSEIGANVKIGDYVEVKKSKIGNGTKISHLTYVGDATIGENVNLGCGVVVVNYNGKSKNKTVVGDNAFVGCNSNLVSPVEIKPNSYIAAGSTITDEVPEYSLAIARSKQVIKEDWVKQKGMER